MTTPKKTTKKPASTKAKPAAKRTAKAAPKRVAVPVKEPVPVPAEVLDAEETAIKEGRPSMYRPEFAAVAESVCGIAGLTDAELGAELGVTERTINRWKQLHPEFGEALRLGKQRADARVINALYNNAVGYHYDALDIRTVGVGKGESVIEQTPYKKFVPGDTFAQQYWLNNRRSGDWKAKVELQVEAVVMDVETAQARFFERMTQSQDRQALVDAERAAKGLKGD